jgi:tetratricopeptide (TPR) repeat protein
MEADLATEQNDSQNLDRTVELLDHLSMGIACLGAAEGPDVVPLAWDLGLDLPGRDLSFSWPWHKMRNDHSLSPAELREGAIAYFWKAVQLYPKEPWIWFQIGWNSFAYEDGPCDRETARAALEHTIELDPDSAISHLALVWLLQRKAQLANPQDPRWIETAWDGPIGEHLRNGLNGDITEAVTGRWGVGSFPLSSLWCAYLLTPGSRSVLFEALDALWDLEIIPDDYRFACAATCGLLANGDRLKLGWYEEALKWPTDDQRLLLRVHWRIADLTQNNLKRRFEHYLKVYYYMLKLWGSRDYDLDLAVSWLDDVCLAVSQHQDDITPDMVPTLQAIADAGLEMADKGWAWETGATLSCALGPLVATTGLLLFKKSDVTHAREYLAVAEELDQELEATWHDAFEEESYFDVYDRSPNDWRVVTASTLRDICINDGDYSGAKRHNDHILELLPGDREARQAKPQIDINARSERHHVELTHRLNVLQSKTDELRTEFFLQHTAREHLDQIREDIETLTQRQALTPDRIDGVIEELHDIVQRGLLMQPLAVQKARQRLIGELGMDVFNQLQPNSQHFLTTAEVFFACSEDIASEIDAALISVEHAKVVETELRYRFLPAMGRALDDRRYGGKIPIQANVEIGRQGRMTWETRLSQLHLGQSAGLLSQAACGPDTGIVLKTIGVPPLDREWLKHLADDLERVTLEYRNGAAHVEPAERAKVLEFRDLLFKGRLIKRLVELGKVGDRIAPVDRPRRGGTR